MQKQMIIALLLAAPSAAYGYTDPGTGVFLYQAMVATLVGVGWTARRFVGRLLGRGAAKTIAED